MGGRGACRDRPAPGASARAGVAFSADPVSGRRDRIVVSAVAGLGDRLVGGEVDGDDYLLDAATGAHASSARKTGCAEPMRTLQRWPA